MPQEQDKRLVLIQRDGMYRIIGRLLDIEKRIRKNLPSGIPPRLPLGEPPTLRFANHWRTKERMILYREFDQEVEMPDLSEGQR